MSDSRLNGGHEQHPGDQDAAAGLGGVLAAAQPVPPQEHQEGLQLHADGGRYALLIQVPSC